LNKRNIYFFEIRNYIKEVFKLNMFFNIINYGIIRI
jgi:hypothetical protein